MMGGYGLNPSGSNGTSAATQQPSWWDMYTQNAQGLHPLSSLLGQAGNQLQQRSINLLHGDGFRSDAQVYPPLPPPPVTKLTPRPPVPGAITTPGTQQSQPQPQTASSQKPQGPGAGQSGIRGYAHALVDNLGLTSIAHQIAHPIQAASEMQQQTATDPHPFQTALRRSTIDDPLLGISTLRGLAGTAKNSLTEMGQAFGDLGVTPYGYQTPQYGPNYASAGIHAFRAIPVLGSGFDKAMEYASQNGMGDLGNSYWQNVGKVWSSPKAMGTLTGTALQGALSADGIARAAGRGGPVNAVPKPLGVAHEAIVDEISKPTGTSYPAANLLKSNLTPEEISAWLRNSNIPYRAMRDDVWAGNINRNIDLLNEGQAAPPIKVIGDNVWNGTHRVVAGDIHGTMPGEIQLAPDKVGSIPESGTRSFRELEVRHGLKPGS